MLSQRTTQPGKSTFAHSNTQLMRKRLEQNLSTMHFDKQIIDQLKELESLQSEIDILGKSMSESFNEVPNVKLASNDNQAILQLNKKFDNLEQKLVSIFQNLDSKIERTIVSTEDNNGILQDIYTDGLPCNK